MKTVKQVINEHLKEISDDVVLSKLKKRSKCGNVGPIHLFSFKGIHFKECGNETQKKKTIADFNKEIEAIVDDIEEVKRINKIAEPFRMKVSTGYGNCESKIGLYDFPCFRDS